MTLASLSERLRPTALGDLTLPLPDIERLERMLASRNIVNMLFYGTTGTGKTSAARIIGHALGRLNFAEFDGTALGVDSVRRTKTLNERTVENFASSCSLSGGLKLCFIDAADYLPPKAQAALHKIIEDHHRTRFICAVNDRGKLIKPIRSRLLPICFDIEPAGYGAVLDRLVPRYERVLTDIGIAFDESTLRRIIFAHFPDFRQIALHLEFPQ